MYEVIEKPNSLDPSIIMRVCHSTKDGGYIGMEDVAKMLCDELGIQPELIPGNKVCSIGFCEKEHKWYGWSHRAIYGFGVGSKVSKGDCAYVADTPEGLIDSRAEFFADISEESAAEKRAECQVLDDRSGIRILHTPMKINAVTDINDLADAIEGDESVMQEVTLWEDALSIEKCGRGEWTAETLDDAKQMAIDFANSVA